ncbi:hypothetical protein BCR42DRAFT_420419 [Absidia repens]|uniref:Uncharacterized protein n=1 Tax=Absidia repens TaxID=90262 RepID=A0A1X2I9P0_9FUNG|nr:hypothetical protein BCR42DRAFT_420419 [Absidia repens]
MLTRKRGKVHSLSAPQTKVPQQHCQQSDLHHLSLLIQQFSSQLNLMLAQQQGQQQQKHSDNDIGGNIIDKQEQQTNSQCHCHSAYISPSLSTLYPLQYQHVPKSMYDNKTMIPPSVIDTTSHDIPGYTTMSTTPNSMDQYVSMTCAPSPSRHKSKSQSDPLPPLPMVDKEVMNVQKDAIAAEPSSLYLLAKQGSLRSSYNNILNEDQVNDMNAQRKGSKKQLDRSHVRGWWAHGKYKWTQLRKKSISPLFVSG